MRVETIGVRDAFEEETRTIICVLAWLRKKKKMRRRRMKRRH
jgi:hypothetical protein